MSTNNCPYGIRPTHALLAIHEGLLLLADVSEPGVKPPEDAPVGTPASAGNMRLFPSPRAGEVNREINAPLAQGTERTMINRKEG